MYVGIVHTGAAAELVVRGDEVYPAKQTQPGPPHQESVPVSCPPGKEGPPRRRRSFNESLDGDSSDGVERNMSIPRTYIIPESIYRTGTSYLVYTAEICARYLL